ECSNAIALVPAEATLNSSGLLEGAVVENEDGQKLWVEDCQCYANFEYDDAQVYPDFPLTDCNFQLYCGLALELFNRAVGFTVADQGGNTELIAPTETLTFAASGNVSVTVTSPRTVYIDVPSNVLPSHFPVC